tara:strand:+ start:4244 stop:4621 length:378 start_codon:yes stop_codon:yes gene_type:complete
MAGETALPIQETPDFFQDVTWSGSIAEDIDETYFYYCERDTIVDSVVAITDTADDNMTIDVKKGAGGTSIFSTIITTAGADAVYAGVLSTTENLVPAGTVLHLNFANVDTATGVLVQARIRTRVR